MQLKNYLTKFMATLALCLLTTSAMAQDRLIFSHDTGQGITGNLGNVGNAIMQTTMWPCASKIPTSWE